MEDLLSVLIVDDELPIRQESKMFKWEKWETVLIGEAENGEDALEFCREYTPDLVITDITMPRMNGIEFFKKLKKEFPCTQVIILTCHSDFDYAQKALRLGAVDYITKVMMEEEELAEALEKARVSIEKRSCELKGEEEALRCEKTQIIREILYSQSNQEQQGTVDSLFIKLKSKGFEIPFPSRTIMLFINTNPQDWLFIRDEIANLLYNYPQDFKWLLTGIGQYLLFFEEGNNIKTIQIKLLNLIKYLNEKTEMELSFIQKQIDIYAAISNVIDSPSDYKFAFEKLRLWNKVRFYQDEKVVYWGYPNISQALSKKDILEIERKMRAVYWDKDNLVEFIKNDFINWARVNQADSSELKNLVIEWRGEWHRKLKYGGNVENFAKQVYQSINLLELVSIMILDIKAEKEERNYRPEIREARNIILEEYHKPITLSSVAEEVGLSSNYLSRLFTEEVGESFNDMITRLRLEKACHLLKNTNMKIYQVAEGVGIASYRYFSVMFRNNIGVTPSEYRKG